MKLEHDEKVAYANMQDGKLGTRVLAPDGSMQPVEHWEDGDPQPRVEEQRNGESL